MSDLDLVPSSQNMVTWAWPKLVVALGYGYFPRLKMDEIQLGRLSNKINQPISDPLISNKERYHLLRHAPHKCPIKVQTKSVVSERVIFADYSISERDCYGMLGWPTLWRLLKQPIDLIF